MSGASPMCSAFVDALLHKIEAVNKSLDVIMCRTGVYVANRRRKGSSCDEARKVEEAVGYAKACNARTNAHIEKNAKGPKRNLIRRGY